MSALDLATAKQHLNITVATYDTELQATIDAAEGLIAKICGPLASTATTSKVDGGGRSRSLALPVMPVISLTSVTGNAGEVVAVSDLSVLPPNQVVYTLGGACFPSAWYTVVYQAGRATVPVGLLFAVKEMVRHLWTSQQGAGRPGNQQPTSTPGFLIPNLVREALEPYKQHGISG